MLATAPSATLHGIEGQPVLVEVHVSTGLPAFHVIGQPDTTCRESRDRVRAALLSSGLKWPQLKVTVNLSPSGLKKIGAGLDLPIAVALLAADEQLGLECLEERSFLGELGLDGTVRPVPGALPLVDALESPEIVVPLGSVTEARLLGRHRVRAVADLSTLVPALRGEIPWPDLPACPEVVPGPPEPDLADVRGQPTARWAVEVAAAGGHHLLLVGPPGAGKSMLARRLPGLLPDLQPSAALEATRIHSAAGMPLPPGGLMQRPPFRRPHHNASAVSLVGGGSASIQPGEISLAHRGVLFLDELGEFDRGVLDNLRQPLEEGVIRISRASLKATLPARFLMVAAMNPCPCGEGGPQGACNCSRSVWDRFARKISGPLLDRFDLRLEVGRPDAAEMLADADEGPPVEPTAVVAARVHSARARARRRGVAANGELQPWQLDAEAPLSGSARRLVEQAMRRGRLTGRGLGGVRRVALTIADLMGHEPPLSADHISLALAFRTEPTSRFGREAS